MLALLQEGASSSALDPEALPDFAGQLARMLVVLVLLLVVLVVALKLLPRFLGGRAVPGAGRIEVLERRPLDGRSTLYLVRVGRRVLLVGRSEGGLVRLSDEDLAGELEGGPSFAERLASSPSPPRS